MNRTTRGAALLLVAALALAFGLLASAEIKGEKPVDWATLAKMDFKSGKYPDAVEQTLARTQLRVRGYAIPVEVADFEKISEFILVPTQFGCCQGPPPDPNQIIDVKLAKPVSFDKLMGMVYLTGKLSVKKSDTGEYGYALSKGEVFEPEYDI